MVSIDPADPLTSPVRRLAPLGRARSPTSGVRSDPQVAAPRGPVVSRPGLAARML